MTSARAPSNNKPAGLQIIGAGFGRTGTMSFKTALDILGFRCYHMAEVFKNKDGPKWEAVMAGKPDWDSIFEGYSATCDWPTTAYYKELMVKYPNAKIILTKRDPEKWFKSFSDTIVRSMNLTPPMWVKLLMPKRPAHFRCVSEGTFENRVNDKEFCIRVYNEHVAEVRRVVPKSQLLEFSVSEGWAPLCAFLGVPVPKEAFPNVNDTKQFQSYTRWMERVFMAAHALTGFVAAGAFIGAAVVARKYLLK
ncbi:hypothetical protein HDU98_003277 [Podochytrium sp. JEL0797]|nr:hypothetical protein HDU98_003277 [Podochytrium sp. JEL0797]